MAASYPGAVKTFVSNAAGDKILSAYVNEIRDEITAIEGGILNGTAPVNAAASTFTSLSVSGGSTLTTLQAGASTVTTLSAGASTLTSLNVAGGSTLRDLMPAANDTYALGNSTRKWMIHGSQLSTGTVAVAALASTAGTADTTTFFRGDGVWAIPPTRTMAACLVSLSTAISVAKNTEVGLDWLTEDDDKQGMHSTAANSSRITFAASSGLYQVGVSLAFSTAVTATGRNQYVRIVANDTATVASENLTHILEGIAAEGPLMQVSGMYRAEDTAAYVTVRVYQESDTTMSVLSTAVKGGKSFWAYQVST